MCLKAKFQKTIKNEVVRQMKTKGRVGVDCQLSRGRVCRGAGLVQESNLGAVVEEECSRRKQNRDGGTGNGKVCKCNVWSTVPSEPLPQYSPSRGHLDLSTSMAFYKLIVLTPDPRQSMGVKSSGADETNYVFE